MRFRSHSLPSPSDAVHIEPSHLVQVSSLVLYFTRHFVPRSPFGRRPSFALRATCRAPARIWLAAIDFQNGEQQSRSEGVNGVNWLTYKGFFHYRKRTNNKILTDKRIKTGDFVSVYGAKETQKVRNWYKKMKTFLNKKTIWWDRMTEMYFVNIPTTFSVLSLCCDVLYLFKPAFELPAVVSLNSNN